MVLLFRRRSNRFKKLPCFLAKCHIFISVQCLSIGTKQMPSRDTFLSRSSKQEKVLSIFFLICFLNYNLKSLKQWTQPISIRGPFWHIKNKTKQIKHRRQTLQLNIFFCRHLALRLPYSEFPNFFIHETLSIVIAVYGILSLSFPESPIFVPKRNDH